MDHETLFRDFESSIRFTYDHNRHMPRPVVVCVDASSPFGVELHRAATGDDMGSSPAACFASDLSDLVTFARRCRWFELANRLPNIVHRPPWMPVLTLTGENCQIRHVERKELS